MKIGRRIYYDIKTGNVLVDTREREGNVSHTSIEYDISVYKELSERKRETFDFIELEFGQYAQDFADCNDYRINIDTKEIEFSYPNPNEKDSEEKVYQAPLSEKINALEKDKLNLQLAFADLLETLIIKGVL